jgi:hypothetical protein
MIRLICAVALSILCSLSAAAQDLSRELSKLDPLAQTAIVDDYGKKHAEQLARGHEERLAELEKAGVKLVRADVTLTVDQPMKVAFAWPVAAGQKLSDKSRIQRDPHVFTLYPRKDPSGNDVPQQWQLSYKDGTVKAIP